MTDTITLSGLVATVPRHIVTSEGLAITSFRLASTQRRYDRVKQGWTDGETNWFTVTTFRQFAMNAAASINKGDRIVVAGRLRIRDWNTGEKTGTTVEVDAESLGHDLAWGSTVFSRSVVTSSTTADAAPTDSTLPPAEVAETQAPDAAADEGWAVTQTESVPAPF